MSGDEEAHGVPRRLGAEEKALEGDIQVLAAGQRTCTR